MKQHDIRIVTPQQTFSQAEDNVVWMYLEFGMAQKYVDDLSRNVKRGLKTKAEMGWFPGSTPVGYLNRTHPDGHKTIAKDPKRFPMVRRCWELMLTGKYNPAEVWSIANTVLGFRTEHGLPMARSTIYHIFRSPFYAGTYEYPKDSGIWHDGRHIPIVTQEEFDQVQRFMDRGRKWPKNRKIFAFTGLIRCGTCNRAVTAEEKHQLICNGCRHKFAYLSKAQCPKCRLAISDMKRAKKLCYTYYHCTSGRRCGERSIEARMLLSQLDTLLENMSVPVPYADWIESRLENCKGVISEIRRVLQNGTFEQQRRPDDPAVAALIQEALRTFFLVDVLIAADQARSLWRQQRDGSIVAILSDLNLPGESGLSVVRELTREGPDVLVVFATGDLYREPEIVERMGVPVRVLSKPFRPSELRAIFASTLPAKG